MGSLSEFFNTALKAYILGLWSADGYYRSSSIGLTTIYPILAKKTQTFFCQEFSKDRLRLRVYLPDNDEKPHIDWFPNRKITYCQGNKHKNPAYQIYVNSRPLLRLFRQAEKERQFLANKYIASFFAGRFDGDGSVSKDKRSDLRIVYKNKHEALIDKRLLAKIGIVKTSVYHYSIAKTYALYVWRSQAEKLVSLIRPESFKIRNLLMTS